MKVRKQYVWILVALCVGCHSLDFFVLPKTADQIVRLAPLDSSQSAQVMADGSSVLLIKATLQDSVATGQMIEFRITEGALTRPGVRPDAMSTGTLSRTAAESEVLVQVNPEQTPYDHVILTAEVAGIEQALSINYSHAYPDEVILSPNSARIPVDSTVTFSLALSRAVGLPSTGLPIAVAVSAPDSTQFQYPTTLLFEGQDLQIPVTNLGQDSVAAQVIVTIPIGDNATLERTATLRYPQN